MVPNSSLPTGGKGFLTRQQQIYSTSKARLLLLLGYEMAFLSQNDMDVTGMTWIRAVVFQGYYLLYLEMSNPGVVPRLLPVTMRSRVWGPLNIWSPVWSRDRNHQCIL